MLEAAIAVVVVSALVLAYLAWTAPEGYEDSEGFHLGRRDEE